MPKDGMKEDAGFAAMKETATNASSTVVAADRLRIFVERIEHLEHDKQELSEMIKAVYAEAKDTGFDAKTLRKVVAFRKKDADQRSEEAAMLDLYLHALGMA